MQSLTNNNLSWRTEREIWQIGLSILLRVALDNMKPQTSSLLRPMEGVNKYERLFRSLDTKGSRG